MLAYIEAKRKKDHARLLINQRNNKSEALKNYIAANLKKGFKKEQIRDALIKNNFNAEDVEEAFKGVK